MVSTTDSIVAVATPPGKGGISIVRISGPGVPGIAEEILGECPPPRIAAHCDFMGQDGTALDNGIALYFPSPNSYTGEHVLELQGHGSPVVMQMLVRRCLELGARIARPGEFSERAFLNDRLDLAQAEAVADLIESTTESAARSAMNSLQGGFSRAVHELTEEVTDLRIYVEAAIDFPDEEIDFLEDGNVRQRLDHLASRFQELRGKVKQGRLIREGLKVVLTGLPNAGKSSLLNVLSDEQRAIVSAIPGTTRDVLDQYLELDGLPVQIVDTAGIRDASNEIEAEGVRRARDVQSRADLLVLVADDSTADDDQVADLVRDHLGSVPLLLVRNKIDLTGRPPGNHGDEAAISALTGAGVDQLREKIKEIAGFREIDDSQFMARTRHLDALHRAEADLDHGSKIYAEYKAGELLADDLSSCHRALGEITGQVSSDDLLGLIFSSFCIGK